MSCPEQIVFPRLLISSVSLYRGIYCRTYLPGWKPVKMPRWRGGRVARNPFIFRRPGTRVTKRREMVESRAGAIRAYRQELIVLWITHRIMQRTVFMCMFSIDNADAVHLYAPARSSPIYRVLCWFMFAMLPSWSSPRFILRIRV